MAASQALICYTLCLEDSSLLPGREGSWVWGGRATSSLQVTDCRHCPGSNPGQNAQGLALLAPLAEQAVMLRVRGGLQFQPPCLCATATVPRQCLSGLEASGIVGILGKRLILYWKGRNCLLKLLPRQSPVCLCFVLFFVFFAVQKILEF